MSGSARVACIVAIALVVGTTACRGDAPSFGWHLRESRVTVSPGERGVFDIVIDRKRNLNSQVRLRFEGSIIGGTVALDPEVLPETDSVGHLVVQTSTETPLRFFDLRIFAWEEGHEGSDAEFSVLASLLVTRQGGPPDFALSVEPSEITLSGRPDVGRFRYFVTTLNDFEGVVEFELTSLGDDLKLYEGLNHWTMTLDRWELGGNGVFQLVLAPTPPVDSPVTLVLTATSGDLVRTATIRVEIAEDAEARPAGP